MGISLISLTINTTMSCDCVLLEQSSRLLHLYTTHISQSIFGVLTLMHCFIAHFTTA